MRNLQKVNQLSTLLLSKDPDQLKEALKAAHAAVKKQLNLPNNIKVSGIKFDLHDGPLSQINDCLYYCQITYPDGSIGMECSDTPCP